MRRLFRAVMGVWCIAATLQAQSYKAVVLSNADGGKLAPRSLNDAGFWVGSMVSGDGEFAVRRTENNVVRLGPGCLNALSNERWAAGYILSNGVQRAVLQWDDVVETVEGSERGSVALGISNRGHVTGWILSESGEKQAFLYYEGRFETLGAVGGSHIGYDVNDSGIVVGCAKTPDGAARGFIYRNGSVEFVLGDSRVYAINEPGQVVGDAMGRAFLYDTSAGAKRELGMLEGHVSCKPIALNDSGLVVGESRDSIGRKRGFVYKDGKIYDLNHTISGGEPLTVLSAFAINNSGHILAEALHAGESVTVYLTPEEAPTNQVTIVRESAGVSSVGAFHFSVSGPAGSTCVVQASLDLRNWQDVTDLQLGDSPSSFQESTNAPQRFYRVQAR